MTRRIVSATKCRRPSQSRCSLRFVAFFGMLVVSFIPPCRAGVGASTRHGSVRYSSDVKPKRSELSVSIPLLFRGGSQPPDGGQPLVTPPDQPSYYSGYNNEGGMDTGNYANPTTQGNEDPFHESVQDRVDEWRTLQREQAASLQDSPRDEKGRVKLLTSVGKGSRALMFFVLMWRDIHLYEIADQNRTGVARLLLVIPMALMFIANLAGAVASLTSPSHSAKKRLKAILNLDKLLEVLLLVFYFIRLTIAPSKYTPREIYISNTLHSVFFILQCQAFTKLSWDDSAAMPVNNYPSGLESAGEQAPARPDDGWSYYQPHQSSSQQTF